MTNNQEIIKEFAKEANLKRDSLNRFFISRMLETGKEYQTIKDGRKKGLSPKNPAKTLFDNGTLTQREFDAAKKYQSDYDLANRDHHSRPSYEMIRSTSPSLEYYSQSQFDSSRRINTVKNIIAIESTKKDKDLKYILILELMLEKQVSARVAEKQTKINYHNICRKVKEICEILELFYFPKKNYLTLINESLV